MSDWTPGGFGEAHADLYEALMGELPDTEETVEYFSAFAGQSLLELGSGTGRLAIPIALAGLDVTAVEASQRMIDVMGQKPGSENINVYHCDFTVLDIGRSFDHVLMSRNTLLGLPSQELQVAAVQTAARHLKTEGRLYIDLGMPDPSSSTAVHYGGMVAESVVLIQRSHDQLRQLVDLKRILIGGNENTILQYLSRYVWPAELDLMAELADLDAIERWSNWHCAPFDRPTGAFISVYLRKRAVKTGRRGCQ